MSEALDQARPWDASYEPTPNGPYYERVLEVRHWTDRLFHFRMERPAAFRFRSGEFVMVGLPVDGKPLLRAYSVASPAHDETLEFYSIKAPDGPLTTRLQAVRPGDRVLLGRKCTGTLVLDALTAGRNLWLFCTGTGFAPFASLIRDPDAYERYERVIVVHGCRTADELAYAQWTVERAREDELVGEAAREKLAYVSTTTGGDWPVQGRVTQLWSDGRLQALAGTGPIRPAEDRVMICGSMAMLKDTKALCEEAGLIEGSNAGPAEFVIERAFVG